MGILIFMWSGPQIFSKLLYFVEDFLGEGGSIIITLWLLKLLKNCDTSSPIDAQNAIGFSLMPNKKREAV